MWDLIFSLCLVGYFTVLSAIHKWWTSEGSSHDLRYYFVWRNWGKPWQMSVKVAGVLVEIQTDHLSNKSLRVSLVCCPAQSGSHVCDYRYTVFWDVAPSSVVDFYRFFGGMCCLHLQGRRGILYGDITQCSVCRFRNLQTMKARSLLVFLLFPLKCRN
jgi:hypothetical protein